MNRRTGSRTKVDLLMNRFLDGHPYMCRMTDISAAGARLIPLLEPKDAPRYMGLQFQLPGIDTILTASGEAVGGADRERGLGVRFTSIPPDCALAIRGFVDSN